MMTPAVLGFALFVSGLGMLGDCLDDKKRPVSDWVIFPGLFIIGGLGLIAFEVNYWLRYFHLIQ